LPSKAQRFGLYNKIAVSGAEQLGRTVNDKVIQPTATAIRDPEFNNNISTYVSNFGTKVTEVGSRGLSLATEVTTKGVNFVTEKAEQIKKEISLDSSKDQDSDFAESNYNDNIYDSSVGYSEQSNFAYNEQSNLGYNQQSKPERPQNYQTNPVNYSNEWSEPKKSMDEWEEF
jgi:hypothetical protein